MTCTAIDNLIISVKKNPMHTRPFANITSNQKGANSSQGNVEYVSDTVGSLMITLL